MLTFFWNFSAHKAGHAQLLIQDPIERRAHLQGDAGGEHVDQRDRRGERVEEELGLGAADEIERPVCDGGGGRAPARLAFP